MFFKITQDEIISRQRALANRLQSILGLDRDSQWIAGAFAVPHGTRPLINIDEGVLVTWCLGHLFPWGCPVSSKFRTILDSGDSIKVTIGLVNEREWPCIHFRSARRYGSQDFVRPTTEAINGVSIRFRSVQRMAS